ncbi:uracil-DNA glycosylase [Sphaerotilus uruguayifluvii]|uniref:Type-4 uracil-DNA glycosylase n=1 Tax=Sphaerotilus uruguayifluvii TaxID=2735897 RepID=A0ABX2FX17_9BURK|nr:uracil-DNA glycosylase [Leptothrix sp. C29]NRT54581.1 DNA polymerase [Leptothrix sp. C29]
MSARWSDRQQAMLREMGVTLWLPPTPAEVPVPEAAMPEPVPAAVAVPVPVQAPVPSPAPAPAPVRMSRPAAVSTEPDPPSVPRPLAARPSGVAAMDWPALREAVAGCEACGLCRSRRNTVFGVGHEQAQWMIVGEAPGEQEDLRGEPFVGKAGQLLDNMLRAVGLTRAEAGPEQQVYIANVLKCRPPMNRNPEPQEVAQCEPFLKRQVELVAPKLILAMGRFAVQSILQTGEPIGRLRGRVHAYHGVPVVVTYHPAYLLRNPADKSRSWEDLCLAREVLRQAGG